MLSEEYVVLQHVSVSEIDCFCRRNSTRLIDDFVCALSYQQDQPKCKEPSPESNLQAIDPNLIARDGLQLTSNDLQPTI